LVLGSPDNLKISIGHRFLLLRYEKNEINELRGGLLSFNSFFS
jgi:hypothetical protein